MMTSPPQVAVSHPDSFTCPILSTLMADPVICSDGYSYERRAITEWIAIKQSATRDGSNPLSPMTGEPLANLNLIPNIALRKAINDYVAGNADRERELEEAKNMDLVKERTEAVAAMQKSAVLQVLGRNTENVRVTPIAEPPPWEFEKAKLAYEPKAAAPVKRLVVVTASRLSNFSGTGLITAWETTPDGLQFQATVKVEIVPESKSKPETTVSALCVVSDDKFFVGLRDGTIGVWEARRGGARDGGKLTLTRTGGTPLKLDLERHREAITGLHYCTERTQLLGDASPNLLASSSRDYTVKLWQRQDKTSNASSTEVWTSVATLSGHRGEVWCVSSLGSHVISGGSDWNLLLWDPESPDAATHRLEGHRRPVRCCATSKRIAGGAWDNLIASGSEDETVRIWDIRTPDSEPVAVLTTGSPVLCCEWGEEFFCAGGGVPIDSMFGTSENAGGWLRVWDPRTWQVMGDAAKSLPNAADRVVKNRVVANGDVDIKRQAHEQATTCLTTTRVAGLRSILTGGDDKKIRLWSSSPRDESIPPFWPRPTLGYEFGGEPVVPLKVDVVGTLFV